MSTNGTNVEDSEMAECDGEKVVTMMDVLQEQQEFEEDANAVLGASDDKNCTYNQGYIKRQALYACLTCCSEAKEDPTKRAGVCLACSLTCHENHDLVELYTKRNFCCDCGNPKFNHPCQYIPKKEDLNDENKYNQNFSGLYCTCHRPYPDPDGVEEEMIQCIICEDWLHASHLEATVPSSEVYAEMVCKGCMEKNDFLHDYSKYAVNGDVDVSNNESDISICNGDTSKLNGVDEADKEHANEEEVAVEEPKVIEEEPKVAMEEPKIAEEESKMEVEESNVAEEEPKVAEEQNVIDEESKLTVEESKLTMEEPKEAVEEPKDAAEEVADESAAKLPDNTDLAESENPSLTSDQNKDEDIETKLTNLESTNVDKPEENEDKHKENPVAEETVVNKDENEQTNTNSENAENVKDNSELTETNVKKESSEDNTEVLANNGTKDETDTEPKEEGLVQTKDTSDTDINTEEAGANQMSKDEIEPKPHETEPETNKDTNEIPNDQPVDSLENQKDSSETNANSEKDIEMDENSKVEENTSEDQTKENKRKLSTEDAVDITSVKKPKLEGTKCTRPRNERRVFKGATFWPSHFRQKLCTCNECIAMYKDLSVLFLIDPEDTVSAYEVLGKERTDGAASTQYEKGLEALSSLGRIQQINALTEYNKMRDKLLDFLKSFKDRKEVVKEDDIKAFFAGMKPKREPDGVYFCK